VPARKERRDGCAQVPAAVSEEFRREAAVDLGISTESIRYWIKQAKADRGERAG
jgi:hypothetical protein